MTTQQYKSLIRIAEPVWRGAAKEHATKVLSLLRPGLTAPTHALNSGKKRKSAQKPSLMEWVTALDPKHPIFNFLIEYYGLKGAKGTKRLLRWSPDPSLMLRDTDRITETRDLLDTKNRRLMTTTNKHDGILLESAREDDLGGLLHLRGAMLESDGVVYSPSVFFDHQREKKRGGTTSCAADADTRTSAAYYWYRSVLQQTLRAEPVLHCHGLHEWAMQYQPEGAQPPPSAKYQSHLPLRVSRETINAAVERRGVSCTHIDALRFFAPAAGPLNHYGTNLSRDRQLVLEQPACVHAQMDLLKMALRLQPFCDPVLLQQVLDIALWARRLDVAASPYNASAYGVGVIPIETQAGRAQYRQEQTALMERAKPVRMDLLGAYDLIIQLITNKPT